MVVAFVASQLGTVRDWVGTVRMTVVGTEKRKAGMGRRMAGTVHPWAASGRKARKSWLGEIAWFQMDSSA